MFNRENKDLNLNQNALQRLDGIFESLDIPRIGVVQNVIA